MPGEKDKGDETEKLIGNIAENVVLRDFVVRNPKFRKTNGQEKELTDILVPFGESVISIQAKSKVVNTESATEGVISGRVKKIIDDAVGQLRNTRLLADDDTVYMYKNTHGIEVPYGKPRVEKIHGLVLVNIYDQTNAHLRVESDYVRKYDIDIHILDVADFYAVSSEIDTIPDLIDYLDARATLLKENKMYLSGELDFLTVYKTQPDLIKQVLDDESGRLVITPGIWDEYQAESAEAIGRRNEMNRESYLVDMTIADMVKSIDYTPLVKNPLTGEPMKPGTVEHYWVIISELSKLRRLDRRILGRKMKEKMLQANDSKYGQGYSLMFLKKDEGLLFFSTDIVDRQERASRLYKLAAAAYAAKDLRKIIGIATEPMSGYGRSFDVMMLEDVTFSNQDELKKQAKLLFGEGRHYGGYEYSDDE